jgi:hypothetical protein
MRLASRNYPDALGADALTRIDHPRRHGSGPMIWIWSKVPLPVTVDRRLGHAALHVYVALRSFSNGRSCRPKVTEVAERAGMSRPAASAYLRKLEKCGHIQIQDRFDRNGFRIASDYLFLDVAKTPAVEPLDGGRVEGSTPAVEPLDGSNVEPFDQFFYRQDQKKDHREGERDGPKGPRSSSCTEQCNRRPPGRNPDAARRRPAPGAAARRSNQKPAASRFGGREIEEPMTELTLFDY